MFTVRLSLSMSLSATMQVLADRGGSQTFADADPEIPRGNPSPSHCDIKIERRTGFLACHLAFQFSMTPFRGARGVVSAPTMQSMPLAVGAIMTAAMCFRTFARPRLLQVRLEGTIRCLMGGIALLGSLAPALCCAVVPHPSGAGPPPLPPMLRGLCLGLAVAVAVAGLGVSPYRPLPPPPLRFAADGTFTVLQLTDLHFSAAGRMDRARQFFFFNLISVFGALILHWPVLVHPESDGTKHNCHLLE